jgi:recombination protein U
MGRGHANRGKGWEQQIRVWNDRYRKEGRAWVCRTSAGIKQIGPSKGGRFQACYAAEGPPDFVGVADGRPVVFDAKDCTGRRWYLSQVKPHQARALEAAQKAGALAFVALRFGGDGWVLPWKALRPLWLDKAVASLTVADMNDLALVMDGQGWLQAAGEL